MSVNDSNDWLASIDLAAVKPTGPRREAKPKKPRRRIIYGEPSRLAPRIPSWAQGRGPDTQRAVTAVAGKFVNTDDLCPASFTYDEAMDVMTLINISEHIENKARLLAVLRAAVAPYEFRQAAEEHRLAEAAKLAELNKTLNQAFGLIKLENEK
jgi:hypothetical protein